MEYERPWLVFGAGAVGTAVVDLLLARRVPVLLAGRNAERLQEVARSSGVSYLILGVSDAHAQLGGVAGLINTAGPFRDTSQQLMQACVRAGVHYVDVSNEADVHEAAWDLDSRAREAQVGVVAGAGLGTWFGERLVHALTREVDHPVATLLITLPSNGSAKSPGVRASENAVVASRPLAFIDGTVQAVRKRVRKLHAGMGPKAALVVGTGDVIALGHSSGLRTVVVAAGVDVSPRWLRLGLPVITAVARRKSTLPNVRAEDPARGVVSDAPRARLRAEVVGADGSRVRARLSSRSGTAVAARAAVMVMEALANGGRAGTYTVFQVLGDSTLGAGFDPVIEIENRSSTRQQVSGGSVA